MQHVLPSKTLVRRLIEQYLMFGLAGLLILVILAIGLNYFSSFNDLVEWAIVVPLVILLLGAYALRRTASLHDLIELQITQVDNRDFSKLQPLPARGALAAGWNSILLRLKEQSTWDGVERRLSDVFGQADASRWQSIFDNLSDGILLTNSQGIITCANQACVVLFEVKDLSQLQDQDILVLLSKFNQTYNAAAWDKLKLPVQSIIVELNRARN